MPELLIRTVSSHPVRKSEPSSILVVIPREARKRLRIKAYTRFAVKIDGRSRLIYEPLQDLEEEHKQESLT